MIFLSSLSFTSHRRAIATSIVSLLFFTLPSCATNPATGKRQLMLVSEGQEIAMGKEADQQFHGMYGDWDPKVQAYLDRVAKPLAAISERPNLEWKFRAVDDPIVNAFALPGGYIYITRGIMTHMNSEAELAGVVGHEIGHVTGRHSASQMSKQMAGVGGLVLGSIFSNTVRQAGDMLQQGLGLMFLKFGRDQESQADGLGLRYILKQDYNPQEMLDVFRMLDAVTTAASGGERLPNWLSTHPAPENRLSAIDAQIKETKATGSRVGREEFLDVLEGMIYGENPREGFFRNQVFYHPDMAFVLTYPQQWRTQNEKQGVTAVSAQQDAMMQLTLAAGDPNAAAAEFGKQKGIQMGQADRSAINGIPALSFEFQASEEAQPGQQPNVVRGVVSFISHDGKTLQLLAYAPDARYASYRPVFVNWLSSFNRLTDQRILSVQPHRLKIERLSAPATAAQMAQMWNVPVKAESIALINGISMTDVVPAGTRVKRVVGERW